MTYGRVFSLLEEKWKLITILAATPLVALIETLSIGLFFILIGSLVTELQGTQQARLFERIQQLFPYISSASYKSQFILLLGAILIMFIVKAVASHILQVRAHRYLLFQSYKQGSKAISKLLHSKFETIEGKRGQAIVHATTTGIETIYQSILSNLIQIFTEIIFLVFVFVAVAIFAPLAVLLISFFTIFLILRNVKLGKIYKVLGIEVRENGIKTKSQIIEAISLFKESFVLGRQQFLADRPNELRERIAENNNHLYRLQSLNKQSLDLFLLVGACSVIGSQVIFGNLADTVTTTITLGLVVTRVAPSLVRVNTLVLAIKSQHASALTALELLNELSAGNTKTESELFHSQSAENKNSGLSINEFQGHTTLYDNSRLINIEIGRGSLLAVLGRSGTGKTTFLEQLLGVRKFVSGSVNFAGLDIEYAIKWFPGTISYAPQVPVIMDATLSENITFGSTYDEGKLYSVLNVVFGDDKSYIEGFLARPLGENGSFLSGGEKQRIGIARAIYSNPKLLFLDECTSALDTISERQILTRLRNYLDDPILVLSTHRIKSVMQADMVIFFNGIGSFTYGTIDQVRAHSSLFDSLVTDSGVSNL